MKQKEILEKLKRIEESISAKGHPMQDFSTVKIAMLDLISVVRDIIEKKGEKDA